ncbi:MAG: M20/M25/M40 family metallo-hydrolase, partial [Chloroflexi bacterium]|nr:M20/M25/M40 family metallo-hydrolase [Chloroflexota bacterium]
MLAIYSPSTQEGELARYLKGAMAQRGLRATIDEAGNAVGERGTGATTVLLLGHMDTVPGFIPVRIEGGRIFGRGAVDAKGPLATFVAAAASLPAGSDKRVVVIGAVEEETRSSKGAHYILERYRPD